jgi:thioredoxin
MNKSEFTQKISETSKPVIVDFWAPWCAPCRMTRPVLEKLAKEYAGRVEFLPVDADGAREIMAQHRVFGIPAVLALREGKEAARLTGAQSEANYRAMFEALATGGEVIISLAPWDRMLRLGAGALLVVMGLYSGIWLVAGGGLLLAFLGVYDRCPVWKAITGTMKRKGNKAVSE